MKSDVLANPPPKLNSLVSSPEAWLPAWWLLHLLRGRGKKSRLIWKDTINGNWTQVTLGGDIKLRKSALIV